MKSLKFLLILATFLVMVAAIFNLLNTTGPDSVKTGIYIELVVMFLLMIAMIMVNMQEKKIKEIEKQNKEDR